MRFFSCIQVRLPAHTEFSLNLRFPTFSPSLPPRTVKDPNAPKKPLSAYMNFAKATRPKIVKDNAAMTFGEVGKELGAQWGKLTQAQKDKFKSAE